ncbi:hypothetical protein PVAND_016080 [Polypedilum vanderplanki]|uniref:Ion transport domain-containing protein n=1 Tax=Polypedilum vanderplanki TaxID=319348 RepID=A0A9J6BET4_POLVA|nr:hypothetical protein PVAND_016080 [Polypedilum vanderplanki]
MAMTSINIPSFFESPQNALLDAFNRRDLKTFKLALERLKADPNGIIDERLGVSIFKNILSEPNSEEYIKLCIEHGADLYETNKIDLRPPIFYAIDSFSPGNLEIFLKKFDRSEINAKYGDNNCLHLLVQSLKNDNFQQLSECIKILLLHGIDINSPDENSKTPFYYLLKQQSKIPKVSELIEFIVENHAVDLYTYRSEEMKKMFVTQNPHLDVPEKIEANLTLDFMLNLLNKENEGKFVKIFKDFKLKNSKNSNFDENCLKLVHEAVKIGSDEAIKVMQNEGIDCNKKLNEYVNTPQQLAASYGYYKILKLLINSNNVEPNLLHKILHASYQNSPSYSNKVDHQKCFEFALCYCDVNGQDDQGCTPLHYAARHRNHEAVVELLKRNSFIGAKNMFNETPIEDMKLETLEEALNERITLIQIPKEKDQKELKISIDLNFLIPPKEQDESESLEEISKNPELCPLISHPVIATFIFLKWKNLSPIFYTNFIMFSILMWSFIRYIIMCHSMEENERNESGWFWFFKLTSFLGIFALTLRETFQFVVSIYSGINYFRSPINIFEVFFIILALLSQILEHSIDEDHLRVLRAFTILCAAFEFLHLFGELPFLSISCNMVILQKVACTFLKSLLLYSILLISFALSFFILFGGDKTENEDEFTSFAYPGIAIIKTFVMLTGEFDAASLNLHSKSIYYCIMFMLFIFLVTIVIFNLLSAFAVDDTQKIKEKGELVDLCARIDVLRKYEKMIMGGLKSMSSVCKWLEEMVTIFPHSIADGIVYVQPNKGYLLTSITSYDSNSETTLEIDEEENEFGCLNGKIKIPKKSKCCIICNKLDVKIGKKLRNIIEERKEKQNKEMKDGKIFDEIRDLRNEIKELKNFLKVE